MSTERDERRPYGAFRFTVVILAGPGGGEITGYCSDVSGLGSEINYSEYREGSALTNTVTKVPNTFKLDEVTLKRGLWGNVQLFAWLRLVREGAYSPRTVHITLHDEANQPAQHFVLLKAQPKKWVGPGLVAKGGGDCAMEELHLVHEGLEWDEATSA